ncbi:DnaJ-domain-containing protein [Laetiporus sulphureus 93-53]|uniref:DnaJ-domain-containing protein n=1 Tax=Laetiporus sulphureus 93-53 TaxID=1314785 RepID=A0A165C6G3_9APHY|nr:DnaJ-domain-containing protein [Laetiporus sulphureus 93-53]KZT02284.1 DnaJ-domain-containing protein [Laetiporus sulphureus 93-53]
MVSRRDIATKAVQIPQAKCFDVLGLKPDATEEEIKLAYKQLALKWHPDRHISDKETAQKMFIEIDEAYRTLLAALQYENHEAPHVPDPEHSSSWAPSMSAPSFSSIPSTPVSMTSESDRHRDGKSKQSKQSAMPSTKARSPTEKADHIPRAPSTKNRYKLSAYDFAQEFACPMSQKSSVKRSAKSNRVQGETSSAHQYEATDPHPRSVISQTSNSGDSAATSSTGSSLPPHWRVTVTHNKTIASRHLMRHGDGPGHKGAPASHGMLPDKLYPDAFRKRQTRQRSESSLHGLHKRAKHSEDAITYEHLDLSTRVPPFHSTDSKNDWIFPLHVTLEELYYGIVHRYSIARTRLSGQLEDVKVNIDVSPGWCSGTRVCVLGVGNECEDGSFQDITFIVEEVPHPRFTRLDDDLVVSVQVLPVRTHPSPHMPPQKRPGEKSAHPGEVVVQGLDGEEYALTVPRASVKGADGTRIVGAGMPVLRDGRMVGKGDLLIKWEFGHAEKDAVQRSRWHTLKDVLHWRS